MYGFYRINVWDAENAFPSRNIRDCWGCTACLKECHTGAILYFLGADMGGMGSMLSVKEKGDVRIWRVDSPNGETKTIEINMKDSNKY